MATIVVNPGKLHQELLDAGLPAISVSSDGRVDYSRELTQSEQTEAAAVIAAHSSALTTEEARIEAYLNSGISIQSMVFALWNKVMNLDATAADAIQINMEKINNSIN
jgi:hypothetical protein